MHPTDSYERRPLAFGGVTLEQWEDWRWQKRTSIRNMAQLRKVFPELPEVQTSSAREWDNAGFRYQITPHLLALARRDELGNPLIHDPIWRQFFPTFPRLPAAEEARAAGDYSADDENWEEPGEMLTPIAQHKYDNRVILYALDACFSYCLYCFRSLQSTASQEKHGGRSHWEQSLRAIRERPDVNEVIISGGDPLLCTNDMIESMLRDIRAIDSVKAIRIHTRAFSHNPYRVDEPFCELLRKYNVTAMGLHICHPAEITEAFLRSVRRVRASGASTLLLAQMPLIKGVNDAADVLRDLFMGLYLGGVKPYYLFHNLPNTPAASSQRTSVRRGAELMNSLKRRISNAAMPEYVIVHRSGKRTVPQELDGTSEFRYERGVQGHPVIRFKDWRGCWQLYVDGQESVSSATPTTEGTRAVFGACV